MGGKPRSFLACFSDELTESDLRKDVCEPATGRPSDEKFVAPPDDLEDANESWLDCLRSDLRSLFDRFLGGRRPNAGGIDGATRRTRGSNDADVEGAAIVLLRCGSRPCP